jgi:lambda family phage tail tape measure protein
MADLSYTIDVNTTPAQRNIDNFNKKIAGVTSAFDKLKSAVAGIALGAVISRANQFADAIQDLSDVTGIATNVIMGFSNAVLANGGDAEKANTSILKFAQSIGDAAEGGKEAQLAFQKVGISLEDLKTLSEADLLQRAIQGIGKLDSATERMGAQVALFGKNARAINFQGVAGGMGSAVASATQYATAIKAGADAQQALEINLKNLTTALLSVLEPLNNIAANVKISVSAFESLIKVLAYAAGAYLLFTRGLSGITSLMNALQVILTTQGGLWGRLSAQVMLMVSAVASFFKGIGRATGAISGGTSALFSFSAAIAGVLRFLLRFTGVAGIIMAVAEAVNFLSKQFFNFDIIGAATDKLKTFYEYAKKITGLGSADVGAGGGRGGNDAITKQLQERGEELRKQSEQARETESYFRKQEEALKAGVAQFIRGNEAAAKQIDFEAKLVGKTEDQVEMQRGLNDLTTKYTDEIQKLKDAKKQLGIDETELRKIYDGQIASLEKNKQADVARLTASITGLQTAKLLEQDRANMLQRITDQLEKQKSLDESMLKIRQQTQGELDTAGFEQQQMGRSPLEKQFASIQENARKAALEAGRAFSEQFNAEDMGAEDAKKLADGLELIAQRYKQIADIQSANLTQSRSFAQGWKEAFDEYMDSATNAAKRAGEVFSSVTGNMNSAIDKFVETGKFSFSDFARSVIQDLIKIELKAQATQLLKGALSAGGSFFSSLFGFAEGGNPPINKPSIVGEKGPELFIPKTAGTIVPNGGNGGNGGNQPAGNTYITNNISAIDAKSVAQLFAENRRTLFGSVQLAQKELSYSR